MGVGRIGHVGRAGQTFSLGYFNCNRCFTGMPDKSSGSVGRFEKKKKQLELLISCGSNSGPPSLRSPQVHLSTCT